MPLVAFSLLYCSAQEIPQDLDLRAYSYIWGLTGRHVLGGKSSCVGICLYWNEEDLSLGSTLNLLTKYKGKEKAIEIWDSAFSPKALCCLISDMKKQTHTELVPAGSPFILDLTTQGTPETTTSLKQSRCRPEKCLGRSLVRSPLWAF